MSKETLITDHEKEQLQLLLEGNERAFGYFYDRYSLPIYRKLLKMVKVEFVAEEILQTVFIKVWEKRHLIDPEKGIRSYIYQVAQNMVYDFYRDLSRENKLQAAVKLAINDLTGDAAEALLYKETNELLEAAIEQLPDQQRTVFRLCKQEGKSYDEVGELLGISISTVNGHIVRATKKVKTYMFRAQPLAVTLSLQLLLHTIQKDL